MSKNSNSHDGRVIVHTAEASHDGRVIVHTAEANGQTYYLSKDVFGNLVWRELPTKTLETPDHE